MSAIRSGTLIGGKYRLEVSLAEGGMGSVWAARHLALDTQLAIKFIGQDITGHAEARRRFEREAKAAARLRCPNVVQIHDYGLEGDLPFIVMELLDGEDLSARLNRQSRLSIPETVSIVTQVARALRRASEAGIVHRDLKPSNIFLVRGDDEGEIVKVLDFGVAKAPRLGAHDDTTKVGAVIGSPRYMSPEQARGSKWVDHRSDLWSLAVIAFRALTGQVPFQGDDLGDIILKICTEPAPSPSSIAPDLDPEIDDFFARALERDPAKRFQTARDLATAFALAAGQAPPASLSYARPASAPMRSLPSLPALSSGPVDPSGTTTTPDAARATPNLTRAAFVTQGSTGITPKGPIEVEATRPSFQPDKAPARPSPPAGEPSAASKAPAPPAAPTPVFGAAPAMEEDDGPASMARRTLVPREPTPSTGTLTSYHGPIDLGASRPSLPPPPSLRPIAAIAGFACLLGGTGLGISLMGTAPLRPALTAPEIALIASAAAAPSQRPVVEVREPPPRAAPIDAGAPEVQPPAATVAPPSTAPGPRATRKKPPPDEPHSVLGI